MFHIIIKGSKTFLRLPSPPLKAITNSNRIGDIDIYKGLAEDEIKELIER